MDGVVDVKLLITLGGVGASIIGTAAVARAQISRLTEQLKDVEGRLRQADSRTDKLENEASTQVNRLDIIAGMLSPSEREKYARMSERHEVTLTWIERDFTRRIADLEKMHNHKHPMVKDG
jgi:hypothetical protein|tara:strand:+ start:1082 stop:1444 length:363 start_codon:yes stop_codon:yes gene_type:complete